MNDISVIIPYHNEAKTLGRTLDLLAAQTMTAKEIFFIDSSSTDDSSDVIQNWLDKNDHNNKLQIFILDEGTTVPGSSMNVGIRRSSGNFLAFMDCGLLFERDWIKSQMEFMDRHGSDLVSGFCFFQGKTLLDKSAVAQTYGYKRLRPTVPSSLVKKNVFDKTGLFLENRRAGHDVDWVNKLVSYNIRRDTNPEVTIQYNGFNYAKSTKDIFLKTIRYSENAVGLHRYYSHHIYGFCLIFLSAILFLKLSDYQPIYFKNHILYVLFDVLHKYSALNALILFFIFYLITRGYIMPLYKSRSLRIIFEHPLALISLPFIGFLMDLGKIIGYIKGVINFQKHFISKFFLKK